MIKEYIGTKSLEDSNLFLRKLWCELNNIDTLGWQYDPYKIPGTRVIHIGYSTFGEIKFDYKIKGCIKNIYIDSKNKETEVKEAIIKSKSNFRDLKLYNIKLKLEPNDILLAPDEYSTIQIQIHENTNYLYIPIYAFSELDIKFVVNQKIKPLLYIISEYTNLIYKTYHYSWEKDKDHRKYETKNKAYDYNWVDTHDFPTYKEQVLLPTECLRLLNHVATNSEYSREIKLLLNSSNMFYSSLNMLNIAINKPSYINTQVDIVNTIIMSTLEPLAILFADEEITVCEKCGQPKHKISKKIKKLTAHYLESHTAKDIVNRIYKNRSKFLHEGIVTTDFEFIGKVYPQISTRKDMMVNYGSHEFNLFDYSSYIFRRVVFDFLKNNKFDTHSKNTVKEKNEIHPFSKLKVLFTKTMRIV